MRKLRAFFTRFRKDEKASIAVMVALSMIPATGLAGAAIDFGRALRAANQLQIAIDAGTLAGAIIAMNNRETRAQNTFHATLSRDTFGANASATFSTTADPSIGSIYKGRATATIPMTVMKVLGIHSVTITRASAALFGTGDNSCILTLGGELDLEDETLTFNGSPNINLSGCTIRSNKSIKCNGHDTGAIASIAAGNVTNCPNPMPDAGIVPDIHSLLAGNIEKKCGAVSGVVIWDGVSVPSGGDVITVSKDGYKQIHVCGKLRLSGTGTLAGATTASDTVIVVENGDIELMADANLSAPRSTFILTGENLNGKISFPTGVGKSARLAVSSSTATTNPWAGMAVYQDPRSSDIVDMSWGPAATLITDGITYLPRTSLVLGGNAETGPSQCSKLISHAFRINGAVSLKQDATGCTSQQVAQFSAYPRLLQ